MLGKKHKLISRNRVRRYNYILVRAHILCCMVVHDHCWKHLLSLLDRYLFTMVTGRLMPSSLFFFAELAPDQIWFLWKVLVIMMALLYLPLNQSWIYTAINFKYKWPRKYSSTCAHTYFDRSDISWDVRILDVHE